MTTDSTIDPRVSQICQVVLQLASNLTQSPALGGDALDLTLARLRAIEE
jgi:hypothetical protein